MPRILTGDQFTNVTATSTRPIYLVQLQFASVVEYLSSSGEILFDDITYEAGGIDVQSIAGSTAAQLSLFATTDRIAQTIGGSWRGERTCKIYGIPALPESGTDYDMVDALLLIDGYIDSARVSGDRVTVSVVHKHTSSSYTPRLNCSELSAYTPRAGTVFTWEGGTYTLVSKR
jgi:hypothetical protein